MSTRPRPWRTAGRLVGTLAALTAANVVVGRVITGPLGGLPAEVGLIERLQAQRTPARDAVARLVSTTSDVPASIALAVISVPLLRLAGHRWPKAVAPALAMALETVSYVVAGALVNRERPPVERLDHDQPTSSFPSGHVGATVALMVVLSSLAEEVSSPAMRTALRACCLAYPATLAPARVYVGMHYPSDVAAGVLNGLACGQLARTMRSFPQGESSPSMAVCDRG